MNALQGVMAPLVGVTNEYQKVSVAASINQDAVNQAIYNQADAAGASSTQLALLGGALGLYSDEAINAAIKSALIEEKIKALATAYANGDISIADMRTELNNFIADVDAAAEKTLAQAEAQDRVATTGAIATEGMSNLALSTKEFSDEAVTGAEKGDSLVDSFTPLSGTLKDAADAGRDLGTSISKLQDKVVTVTTNFVENGTPPAYSGPDGQKTGQAGAEPYQHFAVGGRVRGGVPGLDSVLIRARPDEQVLPVPEAQLYREGKLGSTQVSSGGDVIHIHTTDSTSSVLEQMAQRQKLKRMNATMGG
jgi:hypothetical protein